MADDQSQRKDQRGSSSRRRSRRRRKGRSKPKVHAQAEPAFQGSLRRLMQDFMLCGRCSFFLAGYRINAGLHALEETYEAATEGWFTLPRAADTDRLMWSAYEIQLRTDTLLYDGCCVECGRRLRMSEAETEDEAGYWEVALVRRPLRRKRSPRRNETRAPNVEKPDADAAPQKE